MPVRSHLSSPPNPTQKTETKKKSLRDRSEYRHDRGIVVLDSDPNLTQKTETKKKSLRDRSEYRHDRAAEVF